jgi:hypothetical protein
MRVPLGGEEHEGVEQIVQTLCRLGDAVMLTFGRRCHVYVWVTLSCLRLGDAVRPLHRLSVASGPSDERIDDAADARSSGSLGESLSAVPETPLQVTGRSEDVRASMPPSDAGAALPTEPSAGVCLSGRPPGGGGSPPAAGAAEARLKLESYLDPQMLGGFEKVPGGAPRMLYPWQVDTE